MIAADKNLLKATLTQGVLSIQSQLIDLYTANLNNIGTLGALIAGFAYTGIAEAYYPPGNLASIVEYFYYFFNIVALSGGVFCVSQATIVSMLGPYLALNGSTEEAVTTAVGHMRDQQTMVFKIGAVCIFSLQTAVCLLTWARRSRGIGAMCTFLYLAVLYVTIKRGLLAFSLFKLDDEDTGADVICDI
jgi:hypothetical protein